MLNKLYILARQVHRLLVVIVILLGLSMSFSGSLLKFPQMAKLLKLDLLAIRYWHSFFSLFFGMIFFSMALTGLVMYLFPYLKKRRPAN